MNNESPEASAQQQPESSPDVTKSQDPNQLDTAAAGPTDEPPTVNDTSADAQAGAAPPETAPMADADSSQEAGGAGESGTETVGPWRRKIQVGSRRKPMPGASKPVEPEGAAPDAVDAADVSEVVEPVEPTVKPPQGRPVPAPSVRDPLPADLEAELAAAMGDASLDDLIAGSDSDSPGGVVEPESRHKSAITRIHGDNVFFSLGGRNEGIASLRQFLEPPSVGDEVEVIVKSYLPDEGLYELVIPGGSAQVDDWSDLVEGTIVEARITGANTGGLECKVGGLRGFIPASQIAIFRVEDYAEYIDQKMLCVVSEVNAKRKNLVLSRRAVLEREKEEARREMLESLEVGQQVEGVVRKLMDFGAFVDIGGVDGLVHISQLSWDRVNDPSEVLEVGQKIRVKVEKVDTQTGKIGLSYRDLLDHPWHDIETKFPVETVVKGTVSRIAKFGAFVKLAPGIEGLVHISELSHGRVPNVGSVVSEGQTVDVKVLSIDADAQRIALSMKAVIPQPEEEPEEESADGETVQSQAEKLAAQRTKPLKGGVGRDSGGEQFGLKW